MNVRPGPCAPPKINAGIACNLQYKNKRRKFMKRMLCLALFFTLCLLSVNAADVLQWRNNREGIYQETGLLKQWPAKGPKMLWVNEDVGDGYSSPIIVKGNIYLTGVRNGREFLAAYDLQGKQKWATEYSDGWQKSYSEARTTPTCKAGILYVISGCGDTAAIDSKSGKIIWMTRVFEKYQGSPGHWGAAESPLIVDDKVIVTPTGETTTMVALNIKDGSLAWKTRSLNDGGAYVSPLLIEHNGVKQIIGVTSRHIFAVAPQSGEIKWTFDYLGTYFENDANKSRWIINCNTPVFKDGKIFVTSGYDHCGVMLELNKDATGVKMLWKTEDLDVHHGHVVLFDGCLYGANWLSNRNGNWVCLDWNTGRKMYEQEWHSKGNIIYADGMLYCYEEQKGNIALVTASPKGFEVKGTLSVDYGSKAHWAHTVISNGVLYVRHGNALMAYDIKAAE
jgi:outer membrane protein assembly factor BamB